MNFFAELGRLYRYESRGACLRNVRLWRASDLLVWNSADTTRKAKWIVVIVVNVVNTLLYYGIWGVKIIENLWFKLNTVNFSLLPRILHQIFFRKINKHILKYLTIYKTLIVRNIKINFTFNVYSSTYFSVGLKNFWP